MAIIVRKAQVAYRSSSGMCVYIHSSDVFLLISKTNVDPRSKNNTSQPTSRQKRVLFHIKQKVHVCIYVQLHYLSVLLQSMNNKPLSVWRCYMQGDTNIYIHVYTCTHLSTLYTYSLPLLRCDLLMRYFTYTTPMSHTAYTNCTHTFI